MLLAALRINSVPFTTRIVALVAMEKGRKERMKLVSITSLSKMEL